MGNKLGLRLKLANLSRKDFLEMSAVKAWLPCHWPWWLWWSIIIMPDCHGYCQGGEIFENAIQCLHVYISTINLTKIIGDVDSDDVPFDMRAISFRKMGTPAAARLQFLFFFADMTIFHDLILYCLSKEHYVLCSW